MIGSVKPQMASVERYAASVQVPLAGLTPVFVMVHLICTGSPACAEFGTVIDDTTRSEGGCGSIKSGVTVGVALLPSWLPSKTAPMGDRVVAGSVSTNTYQGPVSPFGVFSVSVAE